MGLFPNPGNVINGEGEEKEEASTSLSISKTF
jgi:hypothetical protein